MNFKVIEIAVESLAGSKLNPRKEFEVPAMQELSESIKAHGVLQPIIARPDGEGLEIVCGERRWRAATMAGLETIPTIVRQLTDDQAMELMIIENLQRKDVSPLEEANAYQYMRDHLGRTIESIASEIGVKAHYVARRLKLATLIPEFRSLLEKKKIDLGAAMELAKLEESLQSKIAKDNSQEYEIANYLSTAEDVRELIDEDYSYLISKAPFMTTDVSLYPEMGSCKSCQFNTANQTLLFDDGKEGRCLKRECYDHKKFISFQKTVEAAKEDPTIILGYSSYSNKEDDTVKKLKAQYGDLINLYHYTKVEEPDKPTDPKPVKEDYDDEDDFKWAMEEWQDEMNMYDNSLKDYHEMKDSPLVKKVFRVDKGHEGDVALYIHDNWKKLDKDGVDMVNPQQEAQTNNLVSELEVTTMKLEREGEILREKTYDIFRNQLSSIDYEEQAGNFTEPESRLMCAIMMEDLGLDEKPIIGELDYDGTDDNFQLYKFICDNPVFSKMFASDDQSVNIRMMNVLQREYITRSFSNNAYTIKKDTSILLLMEQMLEGWVGRENLDDLGLAKLRATHQKRTDKLKEVIADLNEKINAAKPKKKGKGLKALLPEA